MEASAAQGRKKRTDQLPSAGCGPRRAKGSEWRAAMRASICALKRGSREAAGVECCMARRCSGKSMFSEIPQTLLSDELSPKLTSVLRILGCSRGTCKDYAGV